jgi:hypothetical protein
VYLDCLKSDPSQRRSSICRGPLLALSRHSIRDPECPLSGVKRT